MSDEIKKRLYEVMSMAPWTELDLSGEMRIRYNRKIFEMI